MKHQTSNLKSWKPRHVCGFTLVEIIVALAIFSIVATVALGALVKIISANKKAQGLQSAITNLNFALETMSREMRVGSAFHCEQSLTWNSSNGIDPLSCPMGTGQLVAFKSSKTAVDTNGDICQLEFAYRFRTDSTSGALLLEKAAQNSCNDVINPSNASTKFISIISPNVTLTGYSLGVQYNSSSAQYPRVSLRIIGSAGVREKEKTYFDVQTSIAARILQ